MAKKLNRLRSTSDILESFFKFKASEKIIFYPIFSLEKPQFLASMCPGMVKITFLMCVYLASLSAALNYDLLQGNKLSFSVTYRWVDRQVKDLPV